MSILSYPSCDGVKGSFQDSISGDASSNDSSIKMIGQEGVLRICGLDECEYNSGMIQVQPFGDSKIPQLKTALHARNKRVRTVHANFMVGNGKKVEALIRNGFWLLQHAFKQTICKPYEPWP